MKTPLLAAALALVLAVSALAAAAPPATSPSPRAALQADPAAVAQILAIPAPAPTPVFLATGAPSDWTLAVCPSIPAGCCEFAWNGSCMYCLVFDPDGCP